MTPDISYSQEDLQDLALAAELQNALLPRTCPSNCGNQIIAARNRMCGTVGGDFYDFIQINEDQHVILIGDVIGHGIRAAMLMSRIMGFLHSQMKDASQPSRIMSELNQMLVDLGNRVDNILSCSMFYAVLDIPSGVFFYVNAGHPRPFLCNREYCYNIHLDPRNLIMGMEEFEPEEGCLTFKPGHRLVLYTDGLIEAKSPRGELFGEARFHEVLNAHAEDDPDTCADALFQAVADFRQDRPADDDETLLIIDRT